MQNTPKANRLHIGIFGKTNSGKSSLVNAITGQRTAIVSPVAGTTTDPVNKSMEIKGIGPVVFIDTAGFDDSSALGAERLEQTRKAADRTDVAIVIFPAAGWEEELSWAEMFRERKTPVLAVLGKSDLCVDVSRAVSSIREASGLDAIPVSTVTGEGVKELLDKLRSMTASQAETTILGDLVTEGDVVMLVMPQDPQAPRGRLILPQAQTIRELLDRRCIITGCVPENMESALRSLAAPPKLIVTDSQAFALVSSLTPPESMLTSFSVLFARYKGDIEAFIQGARAIGDLTPSSRVLIAEACTHAPLEEDIGREKIPRMLRKRVGEELRVDIVAGSDFPEDLSRYDLVIHCGACMFNRAHVLSRVVAARSGGVPITNYGIAIAYLTGILDKVVYPTSEEA